MDCGGVDRESICHNHHHHCFHYHFGNRHKRDFLDLRSYNRIRIAGLAIHNRLGDDRNLTQKKIKKILNEK